MTILWLGPEHDGIRQHLSRKGDALIRTEEKVDATSDCVAQADFIVSYRYRYKVSKEILDRFPRKAINLHISLLPWNGGADPNLWSFLEDSPKGVTIHWMAEAIDGGDVIVQKAVVFESEKTLRETFERLCREMETLFYQSWDAIVSGTLQGHAQTSGGSYHRTKDKAPYEPLLTQGWDTPVADLVGKARKGHV